MLRTWWSPPQVPQATPEPVLQQDLFETRLSELVAALSEQGEDLSELEASARRVHQQRLEVDAAIGGANVAALEAELSEGRARAESAASEDVETFTRQADALSSRLHAIRGTEKTQQRLLAQESELLHALEGMRLARLQSHSSEDLSEQLGEMRSRLEAEAEVEEKLAAARRANQARTTNR